MFECATIVVHSGKAYLRDVTKAGKAFVWRTGRARGSDLILLACGKAADRSSAIVLANASIKKLVERQLVAEGLCSD